jgi:riboflavin kinase/FMN adenylyltransferase
LVNIGVRPTVTTGTTDRRLELHLLDFAGDLYGNEIEVRFICKLRDERKFESAEALQMQIRLDELAARQLLAGGGDWL